MTALRFELGFKSEELSGLSIPVEVRKPNLALVARALSSHAVDVPPGSYFVTATLPAGQKLSARVRVASKPEVTVRLEPERQDASQPPALEAAHFLNETPRVLQGPSRAPVLDITSSFPDLGLGSTEGEAGMRDASLVALRLFVGNPLQGEATEQPLSNRVGSLVLIDAGGATHDAANLEAEAWFEAASQPGSRTELELYATHEHLILQLSQPLAPTANLRVPVGGTQGCRVVLAPGAGGLLGLDAMLPGASAELLLRYQQSGEMAQAAVAVGAVADDAEAMLMHKMADPLSAAVGAYGLLRMGDLERLHDWTSNLANMFGWLPDGVAILGEHLARQGDHAGALGAFLELEHRGLPMFSDGLSFAVNRLRLYASSQLGEAVRAAELLLKLQRYASASDFGAALVLFRGEDPNTPG